MKDDKAVKRAGPRGFSPIEALIVKSTDKSLRPRRDVQHPSLRRRPESSRFPRFIRRYAAGSTGPRPATIQSPIRTHEQENTGVAAAVAATAQVPMFHPTSRTGTNWQGFHFLPPFFFQSTLSHGERRSNNRGQYCCLHVSIHALAHARQL